jgi:hypothetical protein
MKCKFQIGQKVVCICDDWDPPAPGELPEEGKIYTIHDIVCVADEGNEPYLMFDEFGDVQCIHLWFRLLRSQQTDIGVFRRLLKTKHLEDA